MSKILSVIDAMKATEGFVRPMREGEEVLESGLVIGVGLKEKRGEELHIQALVLRTSGLKQNPYLVEIWVDVSRDYGKRVLKEQSKECECPAGLSEKCKHVTAVMLYLARSLESDLDDLSCTDVEQQWGALRSTKLKEYEAQRLSSFCHYKCQHDVYAYKMPEVTLEMEKRWSDKLIRCAPLSEYSIFFSGIRFVTGSSDSEAAASSRVDDQSSTVSSLLSFRSWKALGALHHMTNQKVLLLDADIRQFYEENIAVSLSESTALGCGCQGTPEWLLARKKRLQASKARAQYTYFNNRSADWDKRYQELYHSTFQGNDDTETGLSCEAPAREVYENTNNCVVFETGTLVRPELPWLGASVDGTVMIRDQFIKNIEIKTFKEGKRLSASELCEFGAISSLDKNNNLKINHAHYAQVQLGMLVTGMPECDYIVYSQSGKDFFSVPVPYDEHHVLELGSRLIHIYFDEFLPRIMSDSLQEN